MCAEIPILRKICSSLLEEELIHRCCDDDDERMLAADVLVVGCENRCSVLVREVALEANRNSVVIFLDTL